MKQLLLSLSILLISQALMSQLNVELLSTVEYPQDVGNDVWGYVAPDDREYALMGTFNGLSVVDITDPRNPVEIDFIDQQGSTWRDIKTWGEFAYVTADEAGTTDGLLVIDLSNLPDSISYENMNLDVPAEGIINTCHNIFIDEFGFAFLAGCGNLNEGGLLIWDVKSTPGLPIYVGKGPAEYSHDVYVRNNVAYSAEISKTPFTEFSIFDVTDKNDVKILGSQSTIGNATHNVWLSDNSDVLFTTDEVGDAPIGSYDVSDPSDIKFLDAFRPAASLGSGVVPHNVHVWSDWLIISYYTDGCIIVDAARPDNLIEVGNWDTFLGAGAGFAGAWGAYPFFPSGTIILGDMGVNEQVGRLVVVAPTYVRAAYLEGNVTDASTGAPLNNVKISADDIGIIEFTRADGNYKTGYHESGDYMVTVSSFGYKSEERMVTLTNGMLSIEDFELEPAARISISGTVRDDVTSEGIEGAQVVFTTLDGENSFEFLTDGNGDFAIPELVASEYNIVTGTWGYRYNILDNQSFDETTINNIIVNLKEGYEDVFSLDLGWETQFFGGNQGAWDRDVPIGITAPGTPVLIAPANDSDDIGDKCFVTGNANGLFEGLLLGTANLTSPIFDVTDMDNPVVSYDAWIWITTFNGAPDSEDFIISLDNGIEQVAIDTIEFDFQNVLSGTAPNIWQSSGDIPIKDYIEVTPELRLRAMISEQGFDTAVEGGFDNFRVVDSGTSSAKDIIEADGFNISPNPSSQEFRVLIPKSFRADGTLQLFNMQGQLVKNVDVVQQSEVSVGNNLEAGVYFIQLESKNNVSQSIKVVKTR